MDKVNGNVSGLRKQHIMRLSQLYQANVNRNQFISDEVLSEIASISLEVNREIALYINRKGNVIDVSVGDKSTVGLGFFNEKRSNSRLSGVRCIHTHPYGSAHLSDVDFSALDILNLDAMAAVSVYPEKENQICIALKKEVLSEPLDYYDQFTLYGPNTLDEINQLCLMETIVSLDKSLIKSPTLSNREHIEKAILLAVRKSGASEDLIQESIEELAQLAKTAGVEVVHNEIQTRPKPDVSTYIGSGKANEIRLQAQVLKANVLIFDDELSPAQQRNLEDIIGLKIIDRTALILDIFAQRARTMEGKLQVELAQLNYLLPRLTGKGISLSRLGGGIGTRGPGETKLEVDRRRIRKRISDLNQELNQVRKNRELQRLNRKNTPVPVFSLCGYTNSGKSSLLNLLTNSDVLAEDKLFATLDPTTRKLCLPNNKLVLLTDTVGFINKTPHHLVAAFRATLEEVVESDILLHVVDVSHQSAKNQMNSVLYLLNELGVANKPIITIFNKIDRLSDSKEFESWQRNVPNSVFVSVKTGQGIPDLLNMLAAATVDGRIRGTYAIPYHDSSLLALFYNNGNVISKEYLPEYVLITAELNRKTMLKAKQYLLNADIKEGTDNA